MQRLIDADALAKEIADFKKHFKSENGDYLTGYLCALSGVEGMIAGQPTVDAVEVSDDFGAVLNCAVRYALGRQSYMPSLVIGYITPLIPQLSSKTLFCFDQDVTDQKYIGGYGQWDIDEPLWMRFLEAVRVERTKRGEELYKSWRNDT